MALVPRWKGVNPALLERALERERSPRVTRPAPLPEPKAPPKYGNKPGECHQHHVHDSRKEARRCDALHLMEKAGEIRELTLTPTWDLVVEGMSVGRYSADFGYMEKGVSITEDCKGVRTAVYQLKKKLMLAIYGIEIRET